VAVNNTSTEQTYRKKMLRSYQTYNFIVEANRGTIKASANAIILVVEMDIPSLVTTFPAGYSQRKILLSEELQINLVPAEG
jgi:hypothetical protein